MKMIGFITCFSLLNMLFVHGVEKTNGDCLWIQDYMTPVADFPKSGIVFQWYANLLKEPEAFHRVIQEFAKRYRESHLDAVVGLESRGFIFGAALSLMNYKFHL